MILRELEVIVNINIDPYMSQGTVNFANKWNGKTGIVANYSWRANQMLFLVRFDDVFEIFSQNQIKIHPNSMKEFELEEEARKTYQDGLQMVKDKRDGLLP